MAGAKETPRQQMINLMYLVLTAMLALNVSSSILDKFFFLAEALKKSASQSATSTELSVKSFMNKAKENNDTDTPEYKKKLQSIEAIRAKASEMIKYVDDLEAKVIAAAGGEDKEHSSKGNVRPKNPTSDTEMETLMLGKGEGKNLKGKINRYVTDVVALVHQADPKFKSFSLEPLAKDNEGATEIDKKKSYEERSFQATPAAAVLAVLAHSKSEVRRYELEAIKTLGVEEAPPLPDTFIPIIELESNSLNPGERIKGRVLLAALSSKESKPIRVFVDGAEQTKKDEQGVVVIDEPGRAGKIRVKIVGNVGKKGAMDTLEAEREIKIVEASVQVVGTKTKPILYKGYQQEFEVISSGNKQASKPGSIPGGSIISGPGNKFNIKMAESFTGKETKMTVAAPSGSKTFEFLVARAPDPQVKIKIKATGAVKEISQGVSPGQAFEIVAIQDPVFESMVGSQAQIVQQGIVNATLNTMDGPKAGAVGELASKSRKGNSFDVVFKYTTAAGQSRTIPMVIPVK
ncbi:MAG: hypothetical protein SFU27_09750 [Thermonemataceae bacterium]|nr:hypothetical protein [Thermonemataceae bacterium]